VVVALKAPQWAAAVFFAMEMVFIDGLLFWSTLIGLQWSLPAQLVLIAAGLATSHAMLLYTIIIRRFIGPF